MKTVFTLRGEKQVTREQFIKRWVDYANELRKIGINVTELVEQKAGEIWETTDEH